MAKKRTRVNIGDAIKKTFLDAGESIAQLMTEEPDGNTDTDGDDDGHTHIHVHVNGEGGAAKPAAAAATDDDAEDGDDNSIEGRVSKLEAGQAKILAALEKLGGGTNDDAAGNGDGGGDDGSDTDEDPDMTGDSDNNGDDDKEVGKKQMTGDSAPLGTSYKQLAADCEILVPGFKVPTFDAKLNRKKTVDAMCSTRRRALDIAYHGADRELIEGVNGSAPNIAGMSCGALAVLFKGAVGAKKVLNNRAATGDGRPGQQSDAPAPTSLTLAEINAKNAEYWKSRGVRN